MRRIRQIISVAVTFFFLLSVIFILPSSPANAKVIRDDLKAPIQNGELKVLKKVENKLPSKVVVRQATLKIKPSDLSGTIDSIMITGTRADNTNGPIFGCLQIPVKDDLDLIAACGGPAELLPGGELTYQAMGSGFNPKKGELSIVLKDNFLDDVEK